MNRRWSARSRARESKHASTELFGTLSASLGVLDRMQFCALFCERTGLGEVLTAVVGAVIDSRRRPHCRICISTPRLRSSTPLPAGLHIWFRCVSRRVYRGCRWCRCHRRYNSLDTSTAAQRASVAVCAGRRLLSGRYPCTGDWRGRRIGAGGGSRFYHVARRGAQIVIGRRERRGRWRDARDRERDARGPATTRSEPPPVRGGAPTTHHCELQSSLSTREHGTQNAVFILRDGSIHPGPTHRGNSSGPSLCWCVLSPKIPATGEHFFRTYPENVN